MRINITVIALLLAGCANEEQRCAEKFAMLNAMHREAVANLHRQKAECEAVAMEFNDVEMTRNCFETFAAMNAIARDTVAMINKRKEEPDMLLCRSMYPGI